MNAPEFCERAAELMRERGKQYDKPEGERSMARTVAAFNAVTGRDLSESEGWLLMLLLKQVRQWQQPAKYHADSAEDAVAYSALLAESLKRAGESPPGSPEEPLPLPLSPLVVGGKYRRRDGREVGIAENDGSSIPFRGSDFFGYRADGTALKGSRFDLVERLS